MSAAKLTSSEPKSDTVIFLKEAQRRPFFHFNDVSFSVCRKLSNNKTLFVALVRASTCRDLELEIFIFLKLTVSCLTQFVFALKCKN